MRLVRFDTRNTRSQRLATAKLALASVIWNPFIANCILCYKPGEDIAIDEQLFPTRARCRFTQYMANKSDKFGIKFWLAADVKSKYLINGFPYLGKDDQRPQNLLLGEHVVLNVMEPCLNKGRNVTTDNFFMYIFGYTFLSELKPLKRALQTPVVFKAVDHSASNFFVLAIYRLL
ncbi:Transposase IS4 [Popillia japonica]|uniref:Transposase IS4 n=1 Tax=Popillia japonica TaxID=7064 RepID=A0AAW1JFK4_POPJA